MSDAHYDKVSLLLPMFGSNNGTVFTDYSPVPKTITRFGDTKTVTEQSKYYGSSAYFDGTGDYLSVSYADDLSPGNMDFTVEMWVYLSSVPSRSFFNLYDSDADSAASTFEIGVDANSKALTYIYTASSTRTDLIGTTTITANSWHHIALTRSGTTYRLLMNGVVEATNSALPLINHINSGLTIGAGRPGARYMHGYIDDLRITKGVARYTSNFTPPARLVGQISGMVKDDANANAERIVKAIPRIASNSQVFTTTSATDGTYSLWAPCTEHSVVFLDDDLGATYNDLVHRVIPQ